MLTSNARRFSPGFALSVWIYLALMSALILPYLSGDVIAPHRQNVEVGAPNPDAGNRIENRKFNDFIIGYVPEVSAHLSAPRSGWIALWTNKNELGRPLYHISGFSPAYLPSWLITRIANTPEQFITILSLLTCVLTGGFLMLFCREVGLSPLAGLVSATSIAASPLFMYWLTFPMFAAVWCWSAGVLWSVTRLAKKPDLIGWSALAFSVYSLLMTAYPQPVVYHAYILGGYGLYLAYQTSKISIAQTARFLALCTVAVIVGSAIALPAYLDLAHLSAESARGAPDPAFFTSVLPKFANLTEAIRFFVLGTVPELFGNPIRSNYSFAYDGLSVTPLVIFLAAVGLLVAFRATWGWWLAIGVLCLLSFFHPLYVIGIKYLGFNLSRSAPLGSILLPLTVITAFAVDALDKRQRKTETSRPVVAGVVSMCCVVSVGLLFGWYQAVAIDGYTLVAMLVIAALLLTLYLSVDVGRLAMIGALLVVLMVVSRPLMLRQDPNDIATSSPLLQAVRAALPGESRFAVADKTLAFLPPNLNATLGLASVHTYNSLSSTRYHQLISDLGGKMKTYGRFNGNVSPDYASTAFWMSNIGLVLSRAELSANNLQPVATPKGLFAYQVKSRMGPALQVDVDVANSATELTIDDPRVLPMHKPTLTTDRGDYLAYDVQRSSGSLLILSQKFHRDWVAEVKNAQTAWAPGQSLQVNQVFQAVALPAGTEKVRLNFRPYARHSWIGHVFWLILLITVITAYWRRSYSSHHGNRKRRQSRR